MKKIIFKLILCIMFGMVLTGCGDKINTDSPLYKAKENMIENVDNYNMNINISVFTDFGDVSVKMDCKEDKVNQLSYCKSNSFGVGTESYVDYNNHYDYSKVYDEYGVTKSEWVKTKVPNVKNGQWLDLSNYIFDLQEKDDGSLENGLEYVGVIKLSKLLTMLEGFELPIDALKILNKDITVDVILNQDNYIDSMNFDFELVGIGMNVQIKFADYGTAGVIVIPEEVLNVKESVN